MELFILRHGEAGKRVPAASGDMERSLTVSGREEVEQVAESLTELGIKFDVIAASPLKRASETARIVAKVFKKDRIVELWDELKPEEETRGLYRRLAKQKADASVLLVGHEPYLSSMISELIGGGLRARIALKKAGFARVEISTLNPPSGELRWLLTPRLVKRVS